MHTVVDEKCWHVGRNYGQIELGDWSYLSKQEPVHDFGYGRRFPACQLKFLDTDTQRNIDKAKIMT